MKNTTKLFYILIINISLLLIMGTSIALAEDVPENISVVMDNNYPPYSFLNADGKLQGITIDQWKLFEEKTGIKVTITGMEWSQAFAAMQAGKFDVIDTISFNTERDAYLDYTKPYTTIDVPIFFHQNISGITDVNSLKGFTVAAKKGDNAINILRQNGITSIVEYHSAEDLIKAAKEQKLVVFVMGKPPAMYYMYKMQIQDKFKLSSSYLYTSQFHRAVHAGNKELLDILNNGFGEITESEYKEIDNKWYGNTGYATFKDSALVKWLMISVFTIIVAALFLFIWNRALQNKVFRKTQELSCSLAALQTSEYTFRKLFEKSSDPILILDTYTFIDCNNATLDLLGYESKQEIIGENPWNISPEMQPDGSASKV